MEIEYANPVIDPDKILLPPASYNEAADILRASIKGRYIKYQKRKGLIIVAIGLALYIASWAIVNFVLTPGFLPIVAVVSAFLFLALYNLFFMPLGTLLLGIRSIKTGKVFEKNSTEQVIELSEIHVAEQNAYLYKHPAP